MNCIIIDNNLQDQHQTEEYIKLIPFLTLKGKCTSAFEALNILRNEKIDLIFLEIKLEGVSGIDLIKSLEIRPYFIFITTSAEYAIEGFDLNASDYLLKPIAFDRFLRAVNKTYEIFTLREKRGAFQFHSFEKKSDRYILVKSDYQTQRIPLNDISYIEGLKDYVKIFLTSGKSIVTLNSLKNMSEKLPSDTFFRIHKSYIIAVNKITSIVRNRIVIGEKWLPIGESYKKPFLESIREQ
ncbi:MAG: LytTR family DNA-binding domain-containing protein [Bacteroidota bacterium]|nr:LytTR family DNA-binding domain-containing protein [Bacteroidota bacterium]